jgi:hypothetical protein
MLMDSQVQHNEERIRLLNIFTKVLPDLMTAERTVIDEAYKDGALSAKVKRLIA